MTTEPKPVAVQPREPQLPILRFSLRHLFCFVTLLCVVMAGLVAAADSGVTLLAMLLAALVVILHVSGTALGMRLRAHADERRAWEASCSDSQGPMRPRALAAHLMPRSPLHGHGLPLRRLPLWVAVGAAVGGCAGVAVLAATIGHRTSAWGVAVGAVSTAVVGAWFAFLGASFWAILRQGWRDAVAESHKDRVDQGSKSATLS